MSFHTCRVCNRSYEYNDDIGYDRELCGPICDGREAAMRKLNPLIAEMLQALEWAKRYGSQGEVLDSDSEHYGKSVSYFIDRAIEKAEAVR